ncbi:nitrous oxidase accessory protein NosD [Kibdelosporangium banguiense]|uniref:Nitrous oxidase accessory protein NosD n=1 Tax=Kibdelosporangium banguiense TaxID=1365924 RepID=A0ABS4TLM7_9PSEU|nr:right-handed parallel beta-helix repeat-containing protein [Kibdelosporangium banguiense]MBP2324909.1 nitrous oxidase accessory protein NosD [Kibdelosporangium banguiense]
MLRVPPLALVVLLTCAGLAGCGVPEGAGPSTLRVPQNYAAISGAAEAAEPGDLILVSPGRYTETVRLRTAGVTLRGTDRNAVVIDGEIRRANGVVVSAPGVSVENLTVQANTLNGVLVTGMSDGGDGLAKGSNEYTRLDPEKFPPLQGFRVSYVTAANNGLYGIYAFDAQHGVIERSYASGSADSGIYVGQCRPCDIAVRDNIAERNAVGYEATNASGDLYVLRNRFSGNRVGLTSNSDYQEALVPQSGATVVGNLLSGNAEPESPAQAEGGFGIGIGIAGGTDDLVARNRVEGNPAAGIVLGSAIDLPPLRNRLIGNVLAGNGIDVAFAASARAPRDGNCLQDNILATLVPNGLIQVCPVPAGAQPSAPLPRMNPPRGVPFPAVAAPPPQPGMPGAEHAPPSSAAGLPGPVDVAAIGVPGTNLLAVR